MPWTDSASFRANNCKAIGAITNGIDYYSFSPPGTTVEGSAGGVQQQVKISPDEPHEHPLSMALASPSNIVLPPDLIPTLPPLAGSYQSAQFYYLNETQTGVLALGDFNAPRYTIPGHLLIGLKNLKAIGAKQLIVDVTNNGGGVVCTAEWLHRIIAGARNTTIPQAGFYTEARAQPLAQAITATMVEGLDPRNRLLYTPVGRSFANNTPFEWDYDWLKDPVRKVINGREDFFSQKLGQECQPFGTVEPPDEELFDPKKVVIVSNGHCVSSCSLFSVRSFPFPASFSNCVFDQAGLGRYEQTVWRKDRCLRWPQHRETAILPYRWRRGGRVPRYQLSDKDHQAEGSLPVSSRLPYQLQCWYYLEARFRYLGHREA